MCKSACASAACSMVDTGQLGDWQAGLGLYRDMFDTLGGDHFSSGLQTQAGITDSESRGRLMLRGLWVGMLSLVPLALAGPLAFPP